MRTTMRMPVTTLLVVALWLLGQGFAVAQQGAAGNVEVSKIFPTSIEDDKLNAYTVKFLCGTVFSDRDLPQFPDSMSEPLSPGSYFTVMNIFNPSPSESQGTVLVARSGDELFEPSPGPTLQPLEDRRYTCITFLKFLNIAENDSEAREFLQGNFIKGVISHRFPAEVDAFAIHTFENIEPTVEPAESLDDLNVDPNPVPGGDLPPGSPSEPGRSE